ncbi:MAG: ABC transporter permease [Ignavibacteria bacterium]|nr:ABC transporter permease [Ignavibacteria bacterium]
MKKMLTVAKWEYIQKVKTKAFIISMVLFPLLIIGLAFLPQLLATKQDTSTKVFGFIQCDIDIYEKFAEKISVYKTTTNQPNYLIQNFTSDKLNCDELIEKASKAVFNQNISGFILVKNFTSDSVTIEFRGENVSNIRDISRFEKCINQILNEVRIKNAGLNPTLIDELSKSFEIKTVKISKSGKTEETSFMQTFMTGYVFVILLMMMIIFTGQMLIRSVVEEKSNRIIEILISSCSANELMGGKIIGLSLLGLTQVFIWILISIGIAGPAGASFIPLNNILIILIYFTLGYVFYASVFVAIGSLANTEQEAQQLTSYVSIILIIPIVLLFQMVQEPDSSIVKILTYVPLTTAPMMTMKINIVESPTWEILITVIILLVSIALMIWVAARIFRIGILSYGKPPNLKQLINWIKEK